MTKAAVGLPLFLVSVGYTICEFAMRGIEDPLLFWFMEENASLELLIADLRRQLAEQEVEIRTLYDWFNTAQDRFNTYARMIRTHRNRVWVLERRLLELGEEEDIPGSPLTPFEFIDLRTQDSDDSDGESVEIL